MASVPGNSLVPPVSKRQDAGYTYIYFYGSSSRAAARAAAEPAAEPAAEERAEPEQRDDDDARRLDDFLTLSRHFSVAGFGRVRPCARTGNMLSHNVEADRLYAAARSRRHSV